MRHRVLVLVIILVVLAAAIWVVLPNNPGITVGENHRSFDTVLGLDLQGGMQVLLEADVPADQEVNAQSMQDARTILENRSNGLGVSEVVFQVAGNRRIVGEFPGLTDTEQVVAALKQTGQLEFVDLGDTFVNVGTVVKTSLGGSQVNPTAESPAATETPTSETTIDIQNTVWNTIITGSDLKAVVVTTNNMNQPIISFELSPEGQKVFAEFTTNNVGKFIGIVLDKTVISSPSIDEPITEGKGAISGNFTIDSANALAVQLRYGSLPVALKVIETRIVGPTLGADSLQKSLLAGIVGFIIVILFMTVYYRLPGAVSILAILNYAVLTFALYKIIPVTLTLPGIAGLLLSTGGALDANILIIERLKEELRSGRNIQTALELAWKRAWPSIRDSNLATIITSIILFWFGSSFGASAVKGFALTLALGVAVSLINITFVTRTLLSFAFDIFKIENKAKWFGI
ncbi:MAG: protein translocase subunit SecD [Anaerolineaceae bacterium]|nr:protein translocase subunit SecD [Anaerolineaceae bacterium]